MPREAIISATGTTVPYNVNEMNPGLSGLISARRFFDFEFEKLRVEGIHTSSPRKQKSMYPIEI